MPQATNRKLVGQMGATPTGPGTVYTSMLKARAANQQRASRVNGSEELRLQKIKRVMDRNCRHAQWQRDQQMERLSESLERLEAFRRVLREDYPVNTLHLMKSHSLSSTTAASMVTTTTTHGTTTMATNARTTGTTESTTSATTAGATTAHTTTNAAVNENDYKSSSINCNSNNISKNNNHNKNKKASNITTTTASTNTAANHNNKNNYSNNNNNTLCSSSFSQNSNTNNYDNKKHRGHHSQDTSKSTLKDDLKPDKYKSTKLDSSPPVKARDGKSTIKTESDGKPETHSHSVGSRSPSTQQQMTITTTTTTTIMTPRKDSNDETAKLKNEGDGIRKQVSFCDKDQEIIFSDEHTRTTKMQTNKQPQPTTRTDRKTALTAATADDKSRSKIQIQNHNDVSRKTPKRGVTSSNYVWSKMAADSGSEERHALRMRRRAERRDRMEDRIVHRGFDMNTLGREVNRKLRAMDPKRNRKRLQGQLVALSRQENERILANSRVRFASAIMEEGDHVVQCQQEVTRVENSRIGNENEVRSEKLVASGGHDPGQNEGRTEPFQPATNPLLHKLSF